LIFIKLSYGIGLYHKINSPGDGELIQAIGIAVIQTKGGRELL